MATYDGNTQDYQQLIENGYSFNLSAYLQRGWEILKQNIGGYLGFVIVFIIIAMILGGISGAIAGESALMSFIMRQVINFPMVAIAAGFLLVAHRIATNQEHSFGNFFDGMKDMIQLGLASLVTGLLTMAPLAIAMYLALGPKMMDIYQSFQDPAFIMNIGDEMATLFNESGGKLLMFGSLGLILAVIVGILYTFSQPLILFGRLKFWDAMETSRKLIVGQVLNFFLLALVLGLTALVLTLPVVIGSATGSFLLIFIGGMVALVGFLLYIPYATCVNYAAYEDIVLKNTSTGSMDSMIDEIGSE